MSIFEIAIISVAVVGSAIIKNGVGVGAGIFLLPFLALVLPPKIALGLGAPAMLISDLVGVKNYWGVWDRNELKILLPTAALGVLLGCYLIKVTPDAYFKQCVGVFALLFSAYHMLKMVMAKISPSTETDDPCTGVEENKGNGWLTVLFGFVAGVASTVIHAGGLILSVYMIQKRANPRVFVGTLVLFFAILNCFKLVAYSSMGVITLQTLLLVTVLSPIIIIGGMVGNILNKKIDQDLFRLTVLILIFMIGFRLLT